MFSLKIKVNSCGLIRALEHDSNVKVNRVLIGKAIKRWSTHNDFLAIGFIHNPPEVFSLCSRSSLLTLQSLPYPPLSCRSPQQYCIHTSAPNPLINSPVHLPPAPWPWLLPLCAIASSSVPVVVSYFSTSFVFWSFYAFFFFFLAELLGLFCLCQIQGLFFHSLAT